MPLLCLKTNNIICRKGIYDEKIFTLSIMTLTAVFLCSSGYADTGTNNAMLQTQNSPPGLQGKGGAELPKGLEKQEKTPAGWDKGKKRGWNRSHHKHYKHYKHGNPVHTPHVDNQQ